MTGTIIRILPNKGFCFIRGEDGISRFALARMFVPPIAFDVAREGQRVTFTPTEDGPTGNKMRAVDVTPCS